jgi:hypothetical protein
LVPKQGCTSEQPRKPKNKAQAPISLSKSN